jgi:hypothetical protein
LSANADCYAYVSRHGAEGNCGCDRCIVAHHGIRVLNFRSDEITFEPMNRQQRDPFSGGI